MPERAPAARRAAARPVRPSRPTAAAIGATGGTAWRPDPWPEARRAPSARREPAARGAPAPGRWPARSPRPPYAPCRRRAPRAPTDDRSTCSSGSPSRSASSSRERRLTWVASPATSPSANTGKPAKSIAASRSSRRGDGLPTAPPAARAIFVAAPSPSPRRAPRPERPWPRDYAPARRTHSARSARSFRTGAAARRSALGGRSTRDVVAHTSPRRSLARTRRAPRGSRASKGYSLYHPHWLAGMRVLGRIRPKAAMDSWVGNSPHRTRPARPTSLPCTFGKGPRSADGLTRSALRVKVDLVRLSPISSWRSPRDRIA